MVVVLGSVSALGVVEVEGFVISGKGRAVVVVLELLELLGVVELVVLPILRQPAKSVAVRTRISVMILAFFISNPPEFQNTSLLLLHAVFLL